LSLSVIFCSLANSLFAFFAVQTGADDTNPVRISPITAIMPGAIRRVKGDFFSVATLASWSVRSLAG
jgi:hypothetical protein